MPDPSSSTGYGDTPWLTIIGLGEDGPDGLGAAARMRIAAAVVVYGGQRHIDLVRDLISGETHVWQSPFNLSVESIVARRGTPVVVLASGDPFFFGVGVTLSRHVAADEMHVLPAPSSFSLAASRMGWALQDTQVVSLHGRPVALVRPHLHPGARILALTSDQNGPAELAEVLASSGFGASDITVLEALGGPNERMSRHTASGFAAADLNPLNICAISVVASAGARVLTLAGGLDDDLFEHDGQITKREIRAMTLSALAPRRGELLWDVGAGSGSIAIEWMLCDPAMRAIAIEDHAARADRIARNAVQFGVPGLTIVHGTAPSALDGLPFADAIFVGGGGSEEGVMSAVLDGLKPGGRVVANAVTTEMEAVLLAHHARLGGALVRIDIARAAPVGAMTGWRPAMPVTQWRWVKPRDNSEGETI